MKTVKRALWLAGPVCAAILAAGCGNKATEKPAEVAQAPVEKPGSYRIYVTNESSGDLTVIESTNFSVVANVPLGKRPRGIHASPDGKLIYVALSGSPPAPPGVDEDTLPPPDKNADGIGVFDVATNKFVKMIQGGSDPENFDVSLDGKTLYISNEDVSGVSVLDLASEKIVRTVKIGDEPEGVRITPDGKRVYATSEDDGTVVGIDTATGKKLSSLKVGRRPRNIAFLPDGSRGYVNAENDGTVVLFDTAKNKVVKTLQLGKAGDVKPMMVLLSSDAGQLFVSTGRAHKVFIIDTVTNEVKSSFEVGQRPWGIALSPDGKTLFTANGPSNDVSVVELATQTVTKKVPAPGSPWGVITIAR